MPASTDGYAEAAPALLAEYEGVAFDRLHAPVRDLFPPVPADILDIGAGSGRDAAHLASLGYRVTAAEPVAAMREGGRRLHPSPAIAWIADALPALPRLTAAGAGFDLILATAVWMHLDPAERVAAMASVAALLRPGARFVLTLRHGPVPAGRRMFEVTPEETRALAEAAGLSLLRHFEERANLPRNRAAGITWSRLAFTRPGDPRQPRERMSPPDTGATSVRNRCQIGAKSVSGFSWLFSPLAAEPAPSPEPAYGRGRSW
jgi:SAM-dependent methyltransferase